MQRKYTAPISRRLIVCFMVVMLVPFILLASYTIYLYSKGAEGMLKTQAETALSSDAAFMEAIIQEYRHKAYSLSVSETINKVLEEDDPQKTSENMKAIYEEMYAVMAGDTYKAVASIVSSTGNVRISTHNFPSVYDLRTHSNEWDNSNIITLANRNSDSLRASMISIEDHRIENGWEILFSVLRRTFSASGEVTGYVIIDVYCDAITAEINRSNLFTDVILVDKSSYSAISLIHPHIYGGFSEFPFLREVDSDTYSVPIIGTSLELTATSVNPFIRESFRNWAYVIAFSLLIGILISIILSLIFSRSISRRIRKIVSSMKSFEKGNFGIKLERTGIKEFDELSITFNIMVRRIELLLEKTREEEAKSAEAERKALESQMNPHFLLNTLNTIKALAKMHGEDDIYLTTIRLGKLLRSSIDNRKSNATIRESLDLAECYLQIQKLRFGEKLQYRINCKEDLMEVETPKLIIQTIAENAVTHGLGEKVGEWFIEIDIRERNGMLCISVSDNGVGFQSIPSMDDLEKSQHTGLYNIYRRLQLRYGNDFTFNISSVKGEGSVVSITMPMEEQ